MNIEAFTGRAEAYVKARPGYSLYWRTLRITNTQPVQRQTVAYIWKMITLCGIALKEIFCRRH